MKGNARGREKVGDWRCETAEETYLSLNGRENERSSVVQRYGKIKTRQKLAENFSAT